MAFNIIRNDITKVSADAIVNTANPMPKYAGGTDYAIYMAAGEKELLEERQKIGEIAVGEAVETPAFKLSARYIIHTVGPRWIDGEHGEKEAVGNCYKNSLNLAKKLGCESIAFPLIATGVYGFPKDEALTIAMSVIGEFLDENDMKVTLVVFDEKSFVLSGAMFAGVDSYIDKNYVDEALDDEYVIDRYGVDFVCEHNIPPKAQPEPALDAFEAEDSFVGAVPKSIFNKTASPKGLHSFFGSTKAAKCSADAAEAQAMLAAPAPAMPVRKLDDLVAQVSESWQESLLRLIDEKGYTDTEVYKRANVDRKLFSKIRGKADYQPKKITAIAFALALRLNLDETKDLIGRAGFAFSPSSKFDLIIEYFIEQEVYDTYTINLALFEHDQPLLGE